MVDVLSSSKMEIYAGVFPRWSRRLYSEVVVVEDGDGPLMVIYLVQVVMTHSRVL